MTAPGTVLAYIRIASGMEHIVVLGLRLRGYVVEPDTGGHPRPTGTTDLFVFGHYGMVDPDAGVVACHREEIALILGRASIWSEDRGGGVLTGGLPAQQVEPMVDAGSFHSSHFSVATDARVARVARVAEGHVDDEPPTLQTVVDPQPGELAVLPIPMVRRALTARPDPRRQSAEKLAG